MCSQAMPPVTKKVDGSIGPPGRDAAELPTSMPVSLGHLVPAGCVLQLDDAGVDDRDLAGRHFDALPQCRPEHDVVEASWKLLD